MPCRVLHTEVPGWCKEPTLHHHHGLLPQRWVLRDTPCYGRRLPKQPLLPEGVQPRPHPMPGRVTLTQGPGIHIRVLLPRGDLHVHL